LIDKVYQRKNLESAWKRVRAHGGAGGVDGESIEAFEEQRVRGLNNCTKSYALTLSTAGGTTQIDSEERQIERASRAWHTDVYDRVCQQALFESLGADLRAGIR